MPVRVKNSTTGAGSERQKAGVCASALTLSFDLVAFAALEFWVTGRRAVIGPSVLLEGMTFLVFGC